VGRQRDAAAQATASDNGPGTKVRLTAVTAGVPFYVTSSATNGGAANTQTLTRAATTPNKGPNDWNTAGNWSSGAVPVAGDDVTLDGRGGGNSILYGLNQSTITLATMKHYQGAPAVGTTSLALKVSVTTGESNIKPADGSTPGMNLFNIDTGANATNWTNHASANGGASGLPSVMIAGSHASNVYSQDGGTVGIGVMTPGQACNFPEINVTGGTLTTGSGTTWTTAENNGGTVYLGVGSAAGTLTNTRGTCTVSGATKVQTINADGGTLKLNQRATIADTLNLNGGTVDFSGNSLAYTVTALVVKDGGGTVIQLKPGHGTYTAISRSFTSSTKLTFQAAA
jgi:hypothetical protein